MNLKTYVLEIPVPFIVWSLCRFCYRSKLLFFRHGRSTTELSYWCLPCDLCNRKGLIYSSFVITAN